MKKKKTVIMEIRVRMQTPTKKCPATFWESQDYTIETAASFNDFQRFSGGKLVLETVESCYTFQNKN
jgi:hypothetical protein